MKRITVSLMISIIALVLTSCREQHGYGVVLWSADEIELSSGTIVRIVGESQRQEIFRVEHPDSKDVINMDKWRVAQFTKKSQAQEYLLDYMPFLRTYTEVRKSALPMRLDPFVRSEMIYSLRDGQVLKVLGRSDEREQIGGYKAYWYHLLSSDGVQGWTYGRFLREYVLTESGQAIYDEKDYTGDAILENFFDPANTWRPAYMHDMIKAGAVNLALIKEEYGLFINPESKIISIRLPDQNVDFTYSRVTPVGGDAYMFVDSPFSFTLKPELVEARYNLRGRKYEEKFRLVNQPISQIITEEESRRGAKYREFMALGPTFRSDLGTLTFTGDGRFILNDTEKLQQLQILLESDGNTGKVLFDIYIDESLRSRYDGAFALVFDASGKRLLFAYRKGNGGFEATWAEKTSSQKVILGDHLSSIETIFVK